MESHTKCTSYSARTYQKKMIGVTREHNTNKPSRTELLFEHKSYESNRRNDFCICARKPCVCVCVIFGSRIFYTNMGSFGINSHCMQMWISVEEVRTVLREEMKWFARRRRIKCNISVNFGAQYQSNQLKSSFLSVFRWRARSLSLSLPLLAILLITCNRIHLLFNSYLLGDTKHNKNIP